jgi:hypothetical protein
MPFSRERIVASPPAPLETKRSMCSAVAMVTRRSVPSTPFAQEVPSTRGCAFLYCCAGTFLKFSTICIREKVEVPLRDHQEIQELRDLLHSVVIYLFHYLLFYWKSMNYLVNQWYLVDLIFLVANIQTARHCC